MPETETLIKDNPLLPAEDFTAMRKQGFTEIEKLSHDIWTEYNNSDPGITILEAVIYAVTDLAYRTGFQIKDLLAPENLTDETWKQVFYTARQILHNSALTITDYRKMIVDIKGVRNAWIEPSKEYEVPIWVDYNYFEQRKDEACGCADNLLTTCYGRTALEPATPEKAGEFTAAKLNDLNKAEEKIAKKVESAEHNKQAIRARIDTTTDPYTIQQLKAELKTAINQLNLLNQKKKEIKRERNLLAEMTAAPFIESKIIELEGLYNVMVEFEENVLEADDREEVRQQVLQKLSGHRNLCEDFLSVNAVEYVDFGVGASIALEEYADPDLVLAEMFFIIYKYFTPSIPFNTIQQMLEKGYDVDEIFEGPPLKHGFIENKAIENTDLFRDIRLSDIINEVADIRGIKAITYLHLPFAGFENKDEGNKYFNEWVKYLQDERKVARIVPEKSSILFCKQRDFVSYNTGTATDRRPARMLKLFKDLKTAERKYKLENIDLDLPVPVGENMELEDYYPVTYSLPMCYGVSERAELPGNADEKRIAQALQLKGYLMFFEQLLSDHLVQLNHLRDIFTVDESSSKTYYTRALQEIKGVNATFSLEELLIDHGNHGANKFELILNDFKHVLQNIVDPPELFYKRRNRFLNHFLARFSEDMSEYEAINRWLVPDKVDQRVIQDKINILKNGEYYKISSNRARGYDYTRAEFWNTKNVSGTERRVGRLLGFSDIRRHTLAPANIVTEPVMELNAKKQSEQKVNKKNQPLNVIRIYDLNDNESVLFTSVEVIDGCCIELLMNDIIAHADNRINFKFHDEVNHRARKAAAARGDFWFELWDGDDIETAVLLGESQHFDKKEKRDKAFKELVAVIKLINENEGLHLIEHLLLRPKLDEVLDEVNHEIPVSFLDICIDKCGLGKGLGEGTQVPNYQKKVTRVPAEKCYDNMPWILQYFRYNDKSKKYDQSILFQELLHAKDELKPLKFRRYAAMIQHVRDLQVFGSERINYILVPADVDDDGKIKWSFKIIGDNKKVLAQSPFYYNKRTAKQIEEKTKIKDDIEIEIARLMEWFGYEMDWYCDENPCDHDEDAYSFRATIVLPCWPKRLRDATFQNLVEKTIRAQSPAHTDINVVWLGIPEMVRFEKAYCAWLEEMALTEMPTYEKVNPLVEVINTLKPCGVCEDDCH